MSAVQGTAFVVLIAMALVWFYCLRKLSHQLRDRHPEKYDEMDLEDLWPQEAIGWMGRFDNSRPVLALCRFLFRGDFWSLNDPQVSSLSVFMRQLAVVYLAVFGFLAFSILSQPRAPAAAPAPAAASEAEVIYSRAMDHFRANRMDEALADFRRVIELEPANFQAYRAIDAILAIQLRWDEILTLWDAYLRVEPRDANAYYERGGTNYRKGDFAASYADAAKACELGKAVACPRAERLKSMLK